jgi:hypothetical protein
MKTKEEVFRFVERWSDRLTNYELWSLLQWFPYGEVEQFLPDPSEWSAGSFEATPFTEESVQIQLERAVVRGVSQTGAYGHGEAIEHVNRFRQIRGLIAVLDNDYLLSEIHKAFSTSVFLVNIYRMISIEYNFDTSFVLTSLQRMVSGVPCEYGCEHCNKWIDALETDRIQVPSL